mmetsp:Transcript_14926/g.38304  ORF Transcript_14926/g.38304 Transcript_14926/m.38304 type:complete len:588 (+) Transcript_14926:142-1905(+)
MAPVAPAVPSAHPPSWPISWKGRSGWQGGTVGVLAGSGFFRAARAARRRFAPSAEPPSRRVAKHAASAASGGEASGSSSGDGDDRGAVFFVGIGGAGLAPLARLALAEGWRVGGSDAAANGRTDALVAAGAVVGFGHAAEHLRAGDGRLPAVVVASSAVPASVPELAAARAEAVPVLCRAQWLGRVTEGRCLLAVAGTHGKTTTASLAALALEELKPGAVTAVVGGDVPQFRRPGGGGLLLPADETIPGDGWFVLEADEYERTFLGVSPAAAVVTSVEHDHVDCFARPGDVAAAFSAFAGKLRPGGLLLCCGDDPGAALLAAQQRRKPGACRVQTYGFDRSCDWRLVPHAHGDSVELRLHGQHAGWLAPRQPGTHNLLNAAAAVALAAHAATRDLADPDALLECAQRAAEAVSKFTGVRRRFEAVGSWHSARLVLEVVDDYAHHPTAVAATVAAAREAHPPPARIVAVFQPHTASRLSAFVGDFAAALATADEAFVLDTYAARSQSEGVHVNTATSPAQLAARLLSTTPCQYLPGSVREVVACLADLLLKRAAGGGEYEKLVVLLLGAGDITEVGPELLSQLAQRDP